jgi:phospholipase/lecithinase/hemolysin
VRWSAAEEARLSEMIADGWSLRAMATAFRRSERAVYNKLARRGATRGGRAWTQAENDTIAKALGAGDTLAQAAAKLPHRTRRAVANQANRLGLTTVTGRNRAITDDDRAALLRKHGWVCTPPPACSGVMML